MDPLFFYIPVIDDGKKCLDLDRPLKIIACVFRTFIDIFYVVRIIFQFRTGFIAPSSRVFGRGELVDDPVAIAKRYLSSYFIVDVLSILPLPQVLYFPSFLVESENDNTKILHLFKTKALFGVLTQSCTFSSQFLSFSEKNFVFFKKLTKIFNSNRTFSTQTHSPKGP